MSDCHVIDAKVSTSNIYHLTLVGVCFWQKLWEMIFITFTTVCIVFRKGRMLKGCFTCMLFFTYFSWLREFYLLSWVIRFVLNQQSWKTNWKTVSHKNQRWRPLNYSTQREWKSAKVHRKIPPERLETTLKRENPEERPLFFTPTLAVLNFNNLSKEGPRSLYENKMKHLSD